MSEPLYIDVNPFLQRRLTGVGRYVARLVESLARLVPLRLVTTLQFQAARALNLRTDLTCGQEIAVDPTTVPELSGDIADWTREILNFPKQPHDDELAARCTGMYTFLRHPVRHFRRELGILYDFTPLIVPWTHLPEMCQNFAKFTTEGCKLFEKAVAISEATKADARWLSQMREDDIVVAYPGPSQCAPEHAYPEPVSRRNNVILTVSTLEPRKNPLFLVDWFLNTDVLPSGTELWWAGPKGWFCDLAELRKNRKQHRRIRFLGMVSDAQLCKLYRQATFTVYASLYEGFGYPVLDSLLHGVPVLCSFNSSLQEFAGPGVHYFSPYRRATLDQAYREMLKSNDWCIDRPDLRKKCSWSQTARTVLSLCA
jgi:glycosyltransferase involved in cell wall biosynthesis